MRWICKLEQVGNEDPCGRQICKVVVVLARGVEPRDGLWSRWALSAGF